ncbi:hypothetical protein [Streptomyces sp. NPDC101145]|uniref:hypothetical protein n=1 Tax=Streptomyces sp. NPDC101145 TaxID=3366112 RepID=UPI0038064ADA
MAGFQQRVDRGMPVSDAVAASSAQLTAHLSQHSFPAPEKPGVEEAEPAVALDAMEVLAAERFPWALAALGTRLWPDGEFLDGALSAVRAEGPSGYIERLEAFVEQRRQRIWRCALDADVQGAGRHGGCGGDARTHWRCRTHRTVRSRPECRR